MELSTWLQNLPDKTRKGLVIADESHVYHISTNPDIKQFIPMVGSRQMPTEDRTIPRVCCARSIVDAVRGHAAVSGQAINKWKAGSVGVFYIYRLPFKQYVKPLPAIVPDSGLTNELWVVPNDPTTAVFKAGIVGEFIVSALPISCSAPCGRSPSGRTPSVPRRRGGSTSKCYGCYSAVASSAAISMCAAVCIKSSV